MRDENGRWLKGQSANPSGRTKVVGELKELAREHTSEALATLVEVMNDESAPPAARTTAAVALLDRGYGRPAQAVDAMVTVQHSLADQAAQVLIELSVRAKARKLLEQQPIDVTPNGHAGSIRS